MRITPRAVFGAIFAASVGLLAFASYLQHVQGLEPCPMCILQRYAFFAIGLTALVAAIHGPKRRGRACYARAGRRSSRWLGAGTSMRHSYLQRFPDPPRRAASSWSSW